MTHKITFNKPNYSIYFNKAIWAQIVYNKIHLNKARKEEKDTSQFISRTTGGKNPDAYFLGRVSCLLDTALPKTEFTSDSQVWHSIFLQNISSKVQLLPMWKHSLQSLHLQYAGNTCREYWGTVSKQFRPQRKQLPHNIMLILLILQGNHYSFMTERTNFVNIHLRFYTLGESENKGDALSDALKSTLSGLKVLFPV